MILSESAGKFRAAMLEVTRWCVCQMKSINLEFKATVLIHPLFVDVICSKTAEVTWILKYANQALEQNSFVRLQILCLVKKINSIFCSSKYGLSNEV